MFSLRSSLYPHYGHTADALWILMMLYPNIVEARRGREEHKNHHNSSSPHHRVITCLCCFAVYLLFSHKYFRIRICEVFSLVKILLITFCKLSARCWLLWCVRDNQLLSNLQNQCFLDTRPECGPGLLPLPVLVSTNHLTPAETKKRWRAPPQPRVGQLRYLQLQLQFLHYKCTNYYRAAEGSVTSRCVVCSVTGSSGVTQLLAAVWCQCSLESLCPARRLLQLHRGRSVAREEALDTGACGFHIRWCVSLWIYGPLKSLLFFLIKLKNEISSILESKGKSKCLKIYFQSCNSNTFL